MVHKNTVRLFLLFLMVLIAGGVLAQTDSQSYLDTIFSASGNQVQNEAQAAPEKPVFSTKTDRELMDEIWHRLNEWARLNNRPVPKSIKVVSIKDAKKSTRVSSGSNSIVGASVTVIKVKTLPVGSPPMIHVQATNTWVPASSPKSSALSAEERARQAAAAAAAIAADKALIKTISKRFGIEILGGVAGEGGLWNKEQLQLLGRCLQTLPAGFVTPTKQISRVRDFMGRKTVLGFVYAGVPKVHICDYGVRPVKFEETIVHEMAHVWMFDRANVASRDLYIKTFWPGGKRKGGESPTSSYGSTSVYEDFAEAVRCYWQNGPVMKLKHPQRWAFINQYVFKGKSYPQAMNVASTGSKTLTAKVEPVQKK